MYFFESMFKPKKILKLSIFLGLLFLTIILIQEHYFIISLIFIFSYLLFTRIEINDITKIIIIIGIIIRIFYITGTEWYANTYDVHHGHIRYVEYVKDNYSLPNKTECWECWQPPLYYIVSAFFYKINEISGIQKQEIYKNLQFLSLFVYVGFIYFSILVFKKYIKNQKFLGLAILILIFWPTSIVHSGRIGNDILMYLFTIMSLYFLILYSKNNNKKNLFFSSLFAGLNVLTKLNGIISFAVIFIVLAYKLYQNKKYKTFFIKFTSVFMIFILFLAPNYLRQGTENKDLIISNIDGLSPGLHTRNHPINYISLGFFNLIDEPIPNGYDAKTGKHFFWNYLLKTSIFLENQDVGDYTNKTIASGIIFASFLFYVQVIVMIFLLTKNKIKKNVEILSLLFCSLAAILYIRIDKNFAPTGDFRYIFPVMVPIIILYVSFLNKCIKSKYIVLKISSLASVLILIALSVTLYVRYLIIKV